MVYLIKPSSSHDAVLINEVNDLNIKSFIEERQSLLGTGGMSSKFMLLKYV